MNSKYSTYFENEIDNLKAKKLISYSSFIKDPEFLSQNIHEAVAVIKDDRILFYIFPNCEIEINSKKTEPLKLFNKLYLEYLEIKEKDWSVRHTKEKYRRFQIDLKPYFEGKYIHKLTIDEVLFFIKTYQNRGVVDLSHRLLSDISQVFDYAILLNIISINFCPKIRKAIIKKKVKGFACIHESEIKNLLNKICEYENSKSEIIKYALKFMALTFVRVGELLTAKWDEIDFEKSLWKIPAERMKMKREHSVPLSSQALSLLVQIKNYTNNDEYIFPHYFHNKPLKSNRLIYALYNMGYKNKMTVHGFRSLASSILNTSRFNPDAIEKQLSHEEENRVRRAYNRADYMEERKQMMQWWSDFICDKCPIFIERKQIRLL